MQADVRASRWAGQCLLRDEVMAAAPRHSELGNFKRSDPWHRREVPVDALTTPNQIRYRLPPLDQMQPCPANTLVGSQVGSSVGIDSMDWI
jgi:hypothetical protein